MRDSDIDNVLKQAAEAQQDVDPALLHGISGSLGAGLKPVHALPPLWVLTGGLVLLCGVAGIGGALLLGPHGIRKMSVGEIGLIFPVLGILIWLAAALCVAESIPGSRRPVAPWLLGIAGSVGLAAVFVVLFRDYGMEQFIYQGVKCLVAGVGFAVPVSVVSWLILRRGFVVNPVAAGFANGTLAGLGGLTMLELHCVNFEVPHLIVWHITVVLLSAAAGMLVARVAARRGEQRTFAN